MAATPSDFFKIERTASEIKLELLPRVFEIFVTDLLLGNTGKPGLPLLCLDLLAGLDNQEPTPAAVQWLRQVYRSSNSRLDFNQGTQAVLYDADKAALVDLQVKIEHLPFYKNIIHSPIILDESTKEVSVNQASEEGQPTFAFLDPVQEGFSQQMLLHLRQVEMAGLFLLFNPKDLESALKKAKADSVWHQLFERKLEEIKAFYKQNRNTDKREEYLLNSLEEIFQSKGFYTLRFRINPPDKKQTGYYIVLAAKSAQSYIKLKELLEGYSDHQEDGVPLFGANLQQQQTALFHEHYKFSIEGLMKGLLQDARLYNNMALQQVYEKHSIGTHYSLENYKQAYEKLLRQGKVRFINPKTGHPISKPTYASKIRYSS